MRKDEFDLLERLVVATEGILAWLQNVDTRKWTAQRAEEKKGE